MLRVVRMTRKHVFDGEPGELKGSCPVRGGGKSGDNIKGLPIAITGADDLIQRGSGYQDSGSAQPTHPGCCLSQRSD